MTADGRARSGASTAQLLAVVVLGIAMVTAAVLLGYEERGQTLKGDEWDYAIRLSSQPLAHALFQPPHDKYLMAVPLLLYKGLFETFGISSYTPYRVVSILLICVCAGLFFVLARRRVGDLLALPPAILLLFFGSASEVVATPLRLPMQIAVAAGLGMLIALQRQSPRGDIAACVLLAVALASHPGSIAFAAAAAVLILFRGDRWRRIWVAAVPVGLFAIWSALYGQSGGTPNVDRFAHLPSFVVDSLISVTTSISGASGVIDGPSFDSTFGWIVMGLVLAVALLALARRSKPVTPAFWAYLAALLTLLVSTGLAPVSIFRTPDTGRYLYPEAILALLLLAEVASTVRLPRAAPWAIAAVFAAALVANVADLTDSATRLRAGSDIVKAQLAAVDIERAHVDPNFLPIVPPVLNTGRVRPPGAPGEGGLGWAMRASEYFRIARDFGTPAYSPQELARQPLRTRLAADAALRSALGLKLQPAPGRHPGSPGPAPDATLQQGAARDRGSCVQLRPRQGGLRGQVTLPPGGAWLSGGVDEEDTVAVVRYAEIPGGALTAPQGSPGAYLRIPRDSAPIPWRLWIAGGHPISICALAGA